MSRDKLQRLAIAKSLDNSLKDYIDDLNAECKDELESAFKDEGTTQRRIFINGVDVGTYSARVSKPKVEETFEVVDWDALENWHFSNEDALAFVVRHVVDFAKWHFEQTGEMPNGCKLVKKEIRGGEFETAVLKVKDISVIEQATRARLTSEVELLLEGGE